MFPPRLAALGTLSLPCTTLGMVLQNLIQKAAESAAAAGLERVRLQIEAEVLSMDDQRALRFTIADEASGVAPENLAMLFRKGYSTKSQATNSGLGLHWCANALNALGGGDQRPQRRHWPGHPLCSPNTPARDGRPT